MTKKRSTPDRQNNPLEITAGATVSVIIPCFNAKDFVASAIDSAYRQSLTPKEVIVVDDGSTDGSWELLAHLRRNLHPSLILLSHSQRQNLGESITRSLGLARATGEYVAFLDADDRFHHHKLAYQVAALQREGSVVLCHTAVNVIGETKWADFFESVFHANPTGHPYSLQQQPDHLIRNHICNSSALIRSDVLRSIPFAALSVNNYPDWLCWCLLAEKGQFLYLDQQLTEYRVHPEMATSKLLHNKLLRLYSALEFKTSLLVRSGSSFHALRVFASCLNTFREIIIEYLWYPGYPQQAEAGHPHIGRNVLVLALLAPAKLARLIRSPIRSSRITNSSVEARAIKPLARLSPRSLPR